MSTNKVPTIYDCFQKKRGTHERKKITMLTVYDAWSAKILADTPVDAVLVGDSLSMVMHGEPSTVHASISVMGLHVKAVSTVLKNKLIVADLPFLSYRSDLKTAMESVQILMQAGAHAVKLEGVRGHEKIVKHIIESGVPVMGHLGLTPQSVNGLGGMTLQAKTEAEALQLLDDAKELQNLGAFSVVLECIPRGLAAEVTSSLDIPTIGIGAGVQCDGQILVLHDMLGLQPDFKPKFLKTYLDGATLFKQAVSNYVNDVQAQNYPAKEHSYSGVAAKDKKETSSEVHFQN